MSKVVRTYEQECEFVQKESPTSYCIKKGFVENMRVPGVFYVNDNIRELLFEELRQFTRSGPLSSFACKALFCFLQRSAILA